MIHLLIVLPKVILRHLLLIRLCISIIFLSQFRRICIFHSKLSFFRKRTVAWRILFLVYSLTLPHNPLWCSLSISTIHTIKVYQHIRILHIFLILLISSLFKLSSNLSFFADFVIKDLFRSYVAIICRVWRVTLYYIELGVIVDHI